MFRTILRTKQLVSAFPKLPRPCFATAKQEQSGKYLSQLKEAFMSRPMEENPQFQEKREEIDYADLAKKVQNLSLENKDVAMQLMEIHKDILKVQEESYLIKDLDVLLLSVPSSNLCEFAVQQYVGSLSIPRNEKIMQMFLQYAVKNARTKEERDEVEFYSIYLRKLTALQQGNKEEFEAANEELIRLCHEENHPIASHLVAKEVYKVGLNILNSKYKKSKQEYFNQALDLFSRAAEQGSFQSFYYMAEMAENGDMPGGVDLKLAYEYYIIAAAHDSAQAYFNLAKFYRQGMIEKKNPELEYFYTKQAAELGLTEAQHNLGCMYLEGTICEYDSLKALAWFSYAGAAGFSHSQYNAAKLFIEGGKDGKISVNLNAALTWLDRIHKEGKIDVTKLILEVNEKLEEEDARHREADRIHSETSNK